MAKTTKPTGAQFIGHSREHILSSRPTHQERRLDTVPQVRTERIKLPGLAPRRAITAGQLPD